MKGVKVFVLAACAASRGIKLRVEIVEGPAGHRLSCRVVAVDSTTKVMPQGQSHGGSGGFALGS